MSVRSAVTRGLVVGGAALGLLATTVPPPAVAAPAGDRRPDDVVLLVTGSDQGLLSARRDAASENARVRHELPQLHTLSVGVPPPRAEALQRRLERRGLAVGRGRPLMPADVPNDTAYPSQQQYLEQIGAPSAWAVTHGSSSVQIAVIDTGVNTSHPDLAGKVVASHNTVTGTTNVTDAAGHGTFVAGVAAAATQNGVGIAGSGYDSSLMAIKVADAGGRISSDDVIAGILWAADHGADVINISLGSPGAVQAEASAVTYALGKGALVVASAGNAGEDPLDATTPNYPAAYDGAIAVGAVAEDGHSIAGFSSHGPWVDIGAPGAGIWGTTGNGGYAARSGTSFSSPLVAGTLALLRAYSPGASAAQVRSAVLSSAAEDFHQGLGGVLDMAAAFEHLAPPTQPSFTSPAAGGEVSGVQPVAVSTTAPLVQLSVDGAKVGAPRSAAGSLSLPTWGMANGSHTFGAADCALHACSSQVTAVTVDVQNGAPSVTTPGADGSVVSGPVTFTAVAPGGALRFLVDGAAKGFDSSAPYELRGFNTSTLAEGPHTLRVVECDVTGTSCLGPTASRQLTVHGLHPAIVSAVSPFSPNGDGQADATTFVLRLPDAQSVSYVIRNKNGTVVRGPVDRGTLPAGDHAIAWSGRSASGVRYADGDYTVTVTTSAGALTGVATRVLRLDTVAPYFSAPAGSDGYVFPVTDGYRDAVTLGISVNESTTVNLRVVNSSGTVVRSSWASRSTKGPLTWSWNGRLANGTVLAAGTYRFWFVGHDPALNVKRSYTYRITLSQKKVVTRTATLTRGAYQYSGGGSYSTFADGSPARCASSNLWTGGFSLINDCKSGAEPDGIAWAQYQFWLPQAVSYTSFVVDTYGVGALSPTALVGRVWNYQTEMFEWRDVDVPAGQGWHQTAPVPTAKGRHAPSGLVRIAIVLPDDPYGRHHARYDFSSVRLRLTYKGLV